MSIVNIIQDIFKDWIKYRKFCEAVSKTGSNIHKVKPDDYKII